jgi:hypothetical protein
VSFESEVLALNPILFWRCKDLSGSQITDYSGNDFHGNVVSGSVMLGSAALVETDPFARSVHVPDSFANNICEIATPPPATLLFKDNFSIGCFAQHEPTFGYQYLFGRGGIAGSTSLGLHFLTNGGTTNRTLQAWFKTFDGSATHLVTVASQFPHLNNVNYFHVLTRSGNVVRLYTNGRLVGENVLGDTNPLHIPSSNRVVFGAGANNLGPLQGLAAELMIFDYALNQAQVTTIFESSRFRLPMFVEIKMGTTMLVDLTPPPTYAAFPHSHDFTHVLTERLIRKTEVVEMKDGGEERNGQADKTRQRYSYEIPTLDAAARRRLKALLRANQKSPMVWPIDTDVSDLSDDITAGTSVVIPVDTQYMAYDIGGRAILGDETDYEAVEIEDLDPGVSITAKKLLSDWPAGTPIRPAKRAYIQQDLSLSSITDDTQDVSIVAAVLVEDTPTTPNRITPYVPTLMYRGVEVFDPFEFGLNDTSEAAEDDMHMVSEVLDTGTGIFRVDSDQEFAKEGIGYTFFLDSRELISQWLGWFEARAGRLNNLWVPTMVRDIGELVSIHNRVFDSEITLSDSAYVANYLNDPSRADIAFIGLDETVGLRHITDATASGDNEVLTLSTRTVPYTANNTEFICFLLMCRLDADEVDLAWFTSDLMKVTIKFREVPKEVV